MAALDLAAELLGHRLLAVADAEDRHAGLEDGLRRARAFALGDRGRAAGEDDGLAGFSLANAASALWKGWISQ